MFTLKDLKKQLPSLPYGLWWHIGETTHNGRTVYPYVSIHRVVRTNWRGVGIIEEVCGMHREGILFTYDEVGLRNHIISLANHLIEHRAPEIARASVLANSPKGYVE